MDFSEKDIISISHYLHEIGRIQYKRRSKVELQNNIARIKLDLIGQLDKVERHQ